MGDYKQLLGGVSRWKAIHTLLLVIERDPAVRLMLQDPSLSVLSPFSTSSGSFRDIRIIPGPAFEMAKVSLLRALAEAVLDNPLYESFEFLWLQQHRYRDKLIQFMVQPSIDTAFKSEISDILDAENNPLKSKDDLLAFRGLLAYGNLFFCLQKRHYVNYGPKPSGIPNPNPYSHLNPKLNSNPNFNHNLNSNSNPTFRQEAFGCALSCIQYSCRESRIRSP